MRSIAFAGILSVLLLASPSEGHAEKFQSSFSSDVLDQNKRTTLKPQLTQPQTTTTTSVPIVSTPVSAPSVPTASIQTTIPQTTFPQATTQISFPEAASEIATNPLSTQNIKMRQKMTNPWDLKKPKISVPDNEKKWRMMLAQQQAQAAKKKKTFSERILEELTKYGMLIALGFVILLVIYAVRKEPTKKGQPPTTPEGQAPKKDIWHEDF